MALELNIEGLANESKLYSLENTNYVIKTTHSPICGWDVSIYTKDKEPIITGMCLLSETRNLTKRYHASSPLLPTGDLWLVSKNLDRPELTFYNFGEDKDWNLVYFTKAEQTSLGLI